MNKAQTKKSIWLLLLLFCMGISTACGNNPKGSQADGEKGSVVSLNDSTFRTLIFDYTNPENTEWKYQGGKPAIVDFYADWCGPCRMVSPILKELAKEYADSIVIYKINVDKAKSTAAWAQIQSIPALLFIPTEGAPQMLVGLQTKEVYTKIIRKYLLKEGATK